MELLKDPHITFRKVANLLTISDKTVMDTFYKNLPEHQPILSRVLCIDEVNLGRNSIKKFVAVLLNFETNDIVDIIYGRTKDSLHSFFQKLPKEALDSVEYVSSDMFEGYRTMKGTYFTQARLCIDSFHVIQLINEMFNKQLKAIMKGFDKDSDKYYLLKHKRFLLLKNGDSIDWFKQEYNRNLGYYIYLLKVRELLLNINPIIKEIYDLKETYIAFNRLKDKELIEVQFEVIINSFSSHPNAEVAKVGRTLNKWKLEILNSFTWIKRRRISNGPIESRNKTIKLLIFNAAGYRNFDHLRRRIIYCINQKKKG